MKKLTSIALLASAIFSVGANAANVWTGGVTPGSSGHTIGLIDSGDTTDILLTLNNFTHERCASLQNRVIISTTNESERQKLTSLALSAFHTNTQVSLFIDENCVASRVILLK